MAKYIKTNCKTKIIESIVKNRTNKMGLTVIIAYQNRRKWLIASDFLEEAFKDGVVLAMSPTNKNLMTLSGNDPRIVPEYQRDELIRADVTEEERQENGWHGHVQYKYKFNPHGTIRIKDALLYIRTERLTKAFFIIKTKKK